MYKCRGVKILKVWKAHQFSALDSSKRNKIVTLTCSVWCLPYFQLCQALHIDGGPCQMCSRTLWNPGADCAIQPSCNWMIFAQTTSKQVRNKWAGKQLYRRKISQINMIDKLTSEKNHLVRVFCTFLWVKPENHLRWEYYASEIAPFSHDRTFGGVTSSKSAK